MRGSVRRDIAALLAAIGLYGVVATTVRERASEIGIRLALGATSESIMRLILRQGVEAQILMAAPGCRAHRK
jgi:putative ABC transport system permease protein